MENLNRRNWLKLAGIAGAAPFVSPLKSVIGQSKYPHRSNSDANGLARLNYNENPYAPSELVSEAILNSFGDLCRYPNKEVRKLEKLIAAQENVAPENVVVTGGSREGLKATGLVYGLNGKEIITCVPTYYALLSYAEQFGAYVNKVPLTQDLKYDLDEIDKRISSNTSMVFICNPNNPTGTILEPNALEQFCRANAKRTMVFVDEVYIDYVTEPNYPSMMPLIKQGLNVIISKTFSKIYGLAGMRVGYLIAREDIAQRLKLSLQAGSNVMAVNAGIACLEDKDFYKFSLEKNNEAKEYIYNVLDDLKLDYKRSHSNFVFFHSGKSIHELSAAMEEKNVLIGRPFPPFYDWCRVSTGMMNDVERFGVALREIYS